MIEPRDNVEMDQKLSAAMQVPSPSRDFIAGLWKTMESQPVRPEPRSAFISRFQRARAWASAGVAIILFLMTFFAVGPSRVIAALQSLLKYIPGIGYVDGDSAMRIVRPYEQTIDGVNFAVLAGVVDGQKTVIRYSFTGIVLPTPGPEGPNELCLQSPLIRLPDGAELAGGEGMAGTEDRLKVEGRQSFAAIPPGVDSFDLVFPCLMYAEENTSPKNVALHLQLEPMPPDYPLYQVIELPALSPSLTANPAAETGQPETGRFGIQFTVNRMAEMPNGYLFEGSLSWPTETFSFAHLWTFNIQATDANGREVEIQDASDQGLAGEYDEGKLGWAVRTTGKDFVFPLTFRLPVIDVLQSREDEAFQIDLGSQPEIGQEWNLNYRQIVDGQPVTVKRATLVELPGGFTHDLYLNVEGESPVGRDVSLSFKLDDSSQFPSCAALAGGGGGGGGGGGQDSSGNGGGFSTLVFLGCRPQGKVTMRLDSVSYPLNGGWSTVIDLSGAAAPSEQSR